MPRTMHVVPLEALGDYPAGQPAADMRDLLKALAVRTLANPEDLGVAILTGLPRSELGRVEAWLGADLTHPALPVISRDDALGTAPIPGQATRWVRQRLRKATDINKIVFYSPRSNILEEVAGFVNTLPRRVNFEGVHVRPDGSISRWVA